MKLGAPALIIGLMTSQGCVASEQGTYTLYRNSLVEEAARIHVATFDSDEGAAYNFENCQLAAVLFKEQPSVKTLFWCEKGRFKK